MPAEVDSPNPKPPRPKWSQRIVPYSIATVLAAMAGTAIVGISSQFGSTPSKSLAVVTEPPGATIYVDGQKQDGVSNADLKLKAGKRTIRVEMPGYSVDGAAEQEVDLASSDAPERVAFKMVADPGNPAGAQGLIGQDPAAEPAASPAAGVATDPPSENPAEPTAAAESRNPSPTAAPKDVAGLNEEVEKLKTVVTILLEQQNQYAAKSEVKTEVDRLENEVAELKSELQALRSKKEETSATQPLAKADEEQKQWRAYSGGGVVSITNLMPNTLLVRIAGMTYTLEPGAMAKAEGLKAGQVTTEIVGHEAPRVWELGPPHFRQELVIK
jgi:hypothetical protein